MKILVLFSMIAIPAVSLAQIPAQPENAPAREFASKAPGKSTIDGREIASRATATSAVATRATVAPVLDGKTDDAAWQNAIRVDSTSSSCARTLSSGGSIVRARRSSSFGSRDASCRVISRTSSTSATIWGTCSACTRATHCWSKLRTGSILS